MSTKKKAADGTVQIFSSPKYIKQQKFQQNNLFQLWHPA
jgi:hypothetical protein